MSKGYWLAIYKSIHDADRLAAYAKKASVAIAEGVGPSCRAACRSG